MRSYVLFAVGSYRFAVATGGMEKTERNSKWRWAQQDVIGAAPRLQYIGPGDDTLNIEATIFPHFRGGLGQADSIRSQAGAGRPMPVVDGTGRYYGRYVVLEVGETRTTFMGDGAPRKIEIKVELKRYG